VVGILAYYAGGHGFDSRTVQTFVCMNISVCMYLQKKIYSYLESIIQALQVLTLDKINVSVNVKNIHLFILVKRGVSENLRCLCWGSSFVRG
jgi:hypothetical protein